MGVDINRMRKAHESHQRGNSDFIQLEEGETLVLIHPPSREDDQWEPTAGTNFVPVHVHYGLGKNNSMAASLDPEANTILTHPWIKAELKKRKIRLTGECPIKTALEDGTIEDDAADDMRGQTRFLWGMTPLKHRSRKSAPWTDLPGEPGVAMVGKTLFDGIMEVFYDNGDITNFAGATLVRLERKGSGMNTKYKISADPESTKKPYAVPKPLRAKITKAIAEGGECDLFRIAASLIKAPAEVQALIDGIEVESDVDEDEDEKPSRRRSGKTKAARKVAVEDDEDELDAEDEEEEEEVPRKSKVAAKKLASVKKKPAADDDEDEEDEEEEKPIRRAIKRAKAAKVADEDEDEEDEEPAPKKSKLKAKKAAVAEEDEDEEDEDEEEPPAKKSAARKLASVKKKPAADDEDEDEDEEEPAPKKSKKAAAKKVVDDDEDEDEEDEPAPKRGPAKTRAKATPKLSDDDDIGLDELDAALDDLEDEDEEPRHKKSA